jgi:hypothetical protein
MGDTKLTEQAFNNQTIEFIDRVLIEIGHNINSIKEELYEEGGRSQSEVTEIIKRLGEKHKDQNAVPEFEERLAAIKREKGQLLHKGITPGQKGIALPEAKTLGDGVAKEGLCKIPGTI